uniref:Integrase catalytic domain-containing protein n=1 Tax=Meloidogyne incognita TaxID=6306 RepID=A0A914MDC2_MELIC
MKFWTPCARRIAKIVIKECKKCQRISSPKFALPDMPILPKERVRQSRPFEFVGVDYLGPSMCKIDGGKVKFWIALFTCLSTRGIHLDLITDLSALSFLDILRRFVAQRGAPVKIISDNGNQFITVAKIINANIEEKEIEWKFIPALSPWQGGVYERLVKLVKDSFKRSLGSRILNIEELRTFIKEVEMSINCRPISYISVEKDGPSCLRPIDFIIPSVEIIQKFPEIEDDNFRLGKMSTAEQVQERWIATLKTLQRFWDAWKRDYLIMLRDKAKWTHHNQRNDLKRSPRIGEVVIVHQEGQPRNVWPLGKIVELDGTPARSAKIKIGDKTFIRPINKISPLEIEDENIIEENLNSNNEQEDILDLSKRETKKIKQHWTINAEPLIGAKDICTETGFHVQLLIHALEYQAYVKE